MGALNEFEKYVKTIPSDRSRARRQLYMEEVRRQERYRLDHPTWWDKFKCLCGIALSMTFAIIIIVTLTYGSLK